MAADELEQQKTFTRWLAEIEFAQKDKDYKRWIDRSELIVKRYRDERKGGTDAARRRYNILWSNVQTLGPAVYGKMPKPYAERRFLDRDPVARLASLMLERTLSFQMETCGFHSASEKAVTDYLLPGMGQVWLRYSPEFEADEAAAENAEEQRAESNDTAEEIDEEGDGTPYEKLAFERVCFDYVFYRDFLWGPARCWEEVPWVAKRSWLDKSEAMEAFGKEIADKMTFGDPKNRDWASANEPVQMGKSKKAEVWEIWNKANRCVYFIAPDSPGLVLKTEEDDPLKLEGFWPCPPPLFSTQTNETLIPVPDYVEYQDQAAELDTLTQRIAVVTTAIRANGVYNSEFPALQRLFEDGHDNKLIPVDQWAAFAEKGGTEGAISLVPMDMLIQVLSELYVARDHVISDIYQITGMSDIIRGESDPNETLGAQKIKSHFATGRLGSRQQTVAEFCANIVKIAAEIVSEVFSPESLKLMSGVDQLDKDAVRKAVDGVPQPQAPEGQQVDPAQLQAAWEDQKRQAAMAAQKQSTDEFQAALALLRNDKLRGFRVDIETDSTIADDLGEDKAAAGEFVVNVFKGLEAAAPVIGSAPEMARPVGEMLMWAMSKFRVGRTLEASFEAAMDELEERIEASKNQPPPPDPEMIKAEAQAELAKVKAGAEDAKSKSEIQVAQLTSQAEMARAQADIRVQEVQLESERRLGEVTAQLDAAKLQLEQMQSAEKNDTDMKKAKMAFLQAVTVAQINAGQASDAAQLNAQIETILGFAKIEHEAEQATEQHDHERTMQAEAPKPSKSDG